MGSAWRAGAHPWAARASGSSSVPGMRAQSLGSLCLALLKVGHFQSRCLDVPVADLHNGHVSVPCYPALKARTGPHKSSARQLLSNHALGRRLQVFRSCLYCSRSPAAIRLHLFLSALAAALVLAMSL